jgi:hypothetical protein
MRGWQLVWGSAAEFGGEVRVYRLYDVRGRGGGSSIGFGDAVEGRGGAFGGEEAAFSFKKAV